MLCLGEGSERSLAKRTPAGHQTLPCPGFGNWDADGEEGGGSVFEISRLAWVSQPQLGGPPFGIALYKPMKPPVYRVRTLVEYSASGRDQWEVG